MFLVALFSCCLVSSRFLGCSTAKLSQEIPRCSMDDPKLGSCIVNAAENLRKSIREGGIAEMGIPGYEPRILSTFTMKQESDMMNFTTTMRNYTIRGLDNYDISDIQFDRKMETFKGQFEFDPISITSAYDVNGRALFIPLRGKGNFQAALGPIKGTFEIMGRVIDRRNVTYYDFEEVKVGLNIDDLSIYIEGLFDGDLEQGALTNELVNRNSKVIVKAITPVMEKLCEKYVARYFKWLTRKYPLYELFL